ncbi:hypothetical protein [Microbacterium sp. IEGM 1404]|uniref:hypothetical protein n=1 Tax=Microbacterium sp. IEGM 1404 TaxID=3047084 RepID=UPI0024B64CE3|nr:hypothetical protein [Microbacterium sp. IEGM 1404]MDI9889946.1 hypothetical protein [Microbacterium sp. IEGM 1404]
MRIAAGFWLILVAVGLAPAIWSVEYWVLLVGMLLMGSGLQSLVRRGGDDS